MSYLDYWLLPINDKLAPGIAIIDGAGNQVTDFTGTGSGSAFQTVTGSVAIESLPNISGSVLIMNTSGSLINPLTEETFKTYGSTIGSVPLIRSGIYNASGEQITSFVIPSTNSEYFSPVHFTATITTSGSFTISGQSFTITDSSQLVYVKAIDETAKTSTIYGQGVNGYMLYHSANVITIYKNGVVIDDLNANQVFALGVNEIKIGDDITSNLIKTSDQSPEWAHYTDPVLLVSASDIGAVDATFIDQGGKILCESHKTLTLFIVFTVNDSTGNLIQVLSKHDSAGTDEFVLETSASYQKTLGDASIKIAYQFDVTGIPYVQLQSQATSVGATEGTLTIYYTLA